MNTDCRALSGRISQTFPDLEQVVGRTEFLMKKAVQNSDDGYLDGVALNLHSFYTGVERILEDIARTMEKSIPSGSNWHQSLLLQMSAGISSVRPPVISRETRHCLDEYRAFRHVVRNVYTFHLKSSRLQELSQQLRECFLSLRSDLEKFASFLEQLAEDEGS
ncbi:MAG: hypothetical protein R2941_21940 [Desulfobacterales bacterium]